MADGRENVTLSMEQRHPVALPTRVAVWITIISPFTKVGGLSAVLLSCSSILAALRC